MCSTMDIINDAISRTKCLRSEHKVMEQPLAENTCYRLTQHGVVSEGLVPVNLSNHADAFTSVAAT